jgi:hypothetical protein
MFPAGIILLVLLASTECGHAAETGEPRAQEIAQLGRKNETARPQEETDLLILELKLGSRLLSSEMLGFSKAASLLLPLSGFAKAIEFPIGADTSLGRASGWFIRENRLFSLNMATSKVTIDGKALTFESGLAQIIEDDIFVDVRLLAKWFPIDIDYDIASLSVKLTSREPLPIEEKLIRENRRSKLGEGRKTRNFPRREVPYSMFSMPIFDTSIEFGYKSDQDDVTNNNTRYSVLAAGDLLGQSAQMYISGDDAQRISQARLEMGRKDPDGQLLGLMDATEYTAGDIRSIQVPLVSNIADGRGASVSNFPISTPSEFDRITLEGNLLIGWDVELYRNEVLLDFKSSQDNGRYKFDDVPLLFGVNNLKLIFYGPQGQVREETRQTRVGPGQIKSGETLYRASAVQQDLQLFLDEDQAANTSDQLGKTRAFLEIQHGLHKNISIGTSVSSIPSPRGNHQNYLGMNIGGFIGPFAGRIDAVRDLSKGWAGKISVQTSFGGVSLLGDHSRYYDFSSEQVSDTSDPLLHKSNLRLDGIARVPFIPHVPYSFKLSDEYRASGKNQITAENRASMAVGAAALTNSLSWLLLDDVGTSTSTVTGSATLGGSIYDVRLRGQIAYSLDEERDITSGTLSGDWQIFKDYRLKLGVDKQFSSSRLTTYSGGLSTQLENVSLGGNVEYSHRGDLSAKLTMSFSFGRNPKTGRFFMSGKPMASKGAVASRVYLDKNNNGTFDGGDEPMENVALLADNAPSERKSDADGSVALTGLTAHRDTNISVDRKSLEDPFLTPVFNGASIVPRPGVFALIDIPVVSSGEIDGTVYRRQGKWANEVSDVVVQLVDTSGNLIREVKSAFDGFYLFDFVKPGKYTVRINPDQMTRLNIAQPPSKATHIKGAGSIARDIDFVLSAMQSSQNFRVLLSAFVSKEAAMNAWIKLAESMKPELRGLRPIIEEGVSQGRKKTIFRLFVGPFKTRGAAETVCKQVRSERGQSWCNPMQIQIKAKN